MMDRKRITTAVLGAAALSMLLSAQAAPVSCASTGTLVVPAGAQSNVAVALQWACPIFGAVQVSTLRLTAAQMNVVNNASLACAAYAANPNGVVVNPITVATILVQAAVILQNATAKHA
jgi:hypothetical protein